MPADSEGRVLLPLRSALSAGRRAPDWLTRPRPPGQDAGNTIASVKRFMGRGLQDMAKPDQCLPLKVFCEPAEGGMVSIATADGVETQEVSAEILATLRYRAEDTFKR